MMEEIGYRGGYGWAYYELINLYEKVGDFKNAFDFSKKRIAILAKNLDNKRDKGVYQIRKDYELKLKNQMIEELRTKTALSEIEIKNRTIILISLLVGFILSVITIFLIFHNYQTKQKLIKVHSLIEGQDAERSRVAAELHDGLGGLLATIKTHIQHLDVENKQSEELKKVLDSTNQLLDDACNEVRQISHNLSPMIVSKFGLEMALNNILIKLNQSGNTKYLLEFLVSKNILTNEVEVHIYRILLEIIQNIIKHAKATLVTIQICEFSNELTILVEDDGIGFNNKENIGGLGLKHIENRLMLLNGNMHIDSQKRSGTSISISIPLNKYE